ncbi:MAG: hypothetical protein QGG73_06150 [Candidatus Hydrogenedentes bacterium]|nr:hypothetical protein [Candidatus Hydrogenedentota bacterium]
MARPLHLSSPFSFPRTPRKGLWADGVRDVQRAYHHIIVRDVGGACALLFDEAVESTMDLRDPQQGGFDYTGYFHVAKLLNPPMSKAFFIDLGGGTGPKSFFRNYPDMQIEVAELDPAVQRVAHRYFFLPKDRRWRGRRGRQGLFLNTRCPREKWPIGETVWTPNSSLDCVGSLGRFPRITSVPRAGIVLTDDRAATDLAYRRR